MPEPRTAPVSPPTAVVALPADVWLSLIHI